MRSFLSTVLIGALLVAEGPIRAQNPPAPAPAAPPVTVPGGLNLTNASLTEVIDILARDLKINYILDPRVKGTVTINTYGTLQAVDVRNLLETILRMNGAAMVQVGNVYRIVPADNVSRLPIAPETEMKGFQDSEQMVLDLIFLKYVTSTEMSKLLEQFLGEGAKLVSYDPANLLLIEDNSRNMKRTIDLINLFDSESMAGQRVKSFTLENSRPTDVAKDLDTIFKAYAFSEKSQAVKFIPVDRINTLIAVAPNPAVFKDVATWIAKLDVSPKLAAGAVENHVYKLKYGRAEIVGQVIASLYGATIPSNLGGYGLPGYGGYSRGLPGAGGGFGGGGGGNGSFGGGGFGSSGYGNSGYGNSGFGNNSGGYGNNGFGNGGNVTGGGTGFGGTTNAAASPLGTAAGTPGGSTAAGGSAFASPQDQTGQYLNPSTGQAARGAPRIVPNPFDNTLLVQSTPQQWESILQLLDQLDISPRQVLIDAKIFEVDLTGGFQYGVEAALEAHGAHAIQFLGSNAVAASAGAAGPLALTAGMLVGHSRELYATLTASENRGLTKTIAAPQIIATDSIPASITVGQSVPTLEATSVATGLGGATTNAVSNVGTGVNLNIIARINASGIVTLVIDQDVSAPQPNSSSSIDSPSFSTRNVSTQVTVQDGDTIALGGIIQETKTLSVNGIPFLDRIPYVGGLFGSRSYSTTRTELILFLTPHVIYDTNGISDATEEIKQRMKVLRKDVRNE